MATAKRMFILMVSWFVFMADRLRDFALRLAGKQNAARCVVIYYHAVPESKLGDFAAQMNEVLRCAEPASTENASGPPAGKRFVAVTFDDGYRDTLLRVTPILKSKKIPVTVFIAPDLLGSSTDMRDASIGSAEDRRVISQQELKQLASDWLTIGSHSLSHPRLTQLGPQEAMYELSQSRRVLEALLKKQVDLFCFPFGAFNDDLLSLCRQAGYRRVFTTLPGWASLEAQEFVTGRVRVDPTDWRPEFRLKVAGAYRWLPYAFAVKRKLMPRRLGMATPQNVAANH